MRKFSKRLGLVATMCLMAAATITGCGKNKVDLDSYLDMEYSDNEKSKPTKTPKADTFDPFENVIITSTDGILKVFNGNPYDEMEIGLMSYSVQPGETAKMVVTIEDLDGFASKYGVIPSPMEKEFVVQEIVLDHYMASDKEMSPLLKQALEQNGRRSIIEKNEGSSMNPKCLKNIECEPVTTLFFKSTKGDLNQYYIFYKVSGDIVINGMNYGRAEFYQNASYNNMAIDKDGNSTCERYGFTGAHDIPLSDVSSVQSGQIPGFMPHLYGYKTLEDALDGVKNHSISTYDYVVVE